MANSTTRLLLTEPVGTDQVSELREAITNNATTLDSAVTITEGALAGRPTGSYYGQTYYATDTGQWDFYNGSGWEPLLMPGAALQLLAGSTPRTVAFGQGSVVGGGTSSQNFLQPHGLGTTPVFAIFVPVGFTGLIKINSVDATNLNGYLELLNDAGTTGSNATWETMGSASWYYYWLAIG